MGYTQGELSVGLQFDMARGIAAAFASIDGFRYYGFRYAAI